MCLLLDHCLLLHPEQTARIESKLPVFAVGSLQRRAQMNALLECVKSLLQQEDFGDKLKGMDQAVKDVLRLRPSGKHMNGRDMGRLEPTPSLTRRCCLC